MNRCIAIAVCCFAAAAAARTSPAPPAARAQRTARSNAAAAARPDVSDSDDDGDEADDPDDDDEPSAARPPSAPLPPRPPAAPRLRATPPEPPEPPQPPRRHRSFHVRIPEIEIPEIHIPELDFDLPDLDVPRLLAEAEGDQGARGWWSSRRGDESDEDQRAGASAQAQGRGSATLAVKGPVTFRLRAQNGDVEVVASDQQRVAVSLAGSSDEIALYAWGDRVEPSFRNRRALRHGKLHVEVPKGSKVELESMSGDVQVRDVLGGVRVRTMSGDVKLAGTGPADVQTISGDVTLERVSGPVRLRTVSGHGIVGTTAEAPQLDFQSASGNLDWSGVCGKDCRLQVETMSGDVKLDVDPKSSFDLSYSSHSGDLRDDLQLAIKHASKRKHGMSGGWLEATYGKGEGVIEANAFSGNLVLHKR